MRFEDVFSAQAVAYRQTADANRNIAYLGEAFFPNKKKMGIDLKWIKSHKNVGVALKPSNYDALATIRPREGFETLATQMPLFRESMHVTEQDMAQIIRAQESNDPYLQEVLGNIYDDAQNLVEGAKISAEKMRMQLLAPANGEMKINIGMADNTIYSYDYDEDDTWKGANYLELSNNDKWDAPETSNPLNDFDKAMDRLAAVGAIGKYAVMTTATLNKLVASAQIKNAIVSTAGVGISYIDKQTVKDIIERKTGLQVVVYDKSYRTYDGVGAAVKFFPDGYVSVVGADVLGNTYMGVTPEERTMMENTGVDVAVLDSGIAVATKTIYGPPAQHSVTASMICLPSYEGMDSVYVIKAF